jgi:hypothetical protein
VRGRGHVSHHSAFQWSLPTVGRMSRRPHRSLGCT